MKDRTRVFLSGVTSITHLVYVASYLRCLLDSSPGEVVLADLGTRSFLSRFQVTADDLHARIPDDRRLVVAPPGASRWSGDKDERLVYVAVGAPGIKPLLRLHTANPGRRLHVVVVDEGLGSYGDWRTRRDAWRRESGGGPWPWVRALAVMGARRLFTDERWPLYRRTGSGWVPDPRVAEEFRRGLQDLPRRWAHAVFLTQPWVELGVLTQAGLHAHIRELADQCAAVGMVLHVRPHPAEEAGRYDGLDPRVVLDRRRGPAELDPDVVAAGVVLGTASTALLNVAALHGTAGLRVELPGVAASDAQLNAAQQSLLDAYLPRGVPITALAPRLARSRPPA